MRKHVKGNVSWIGYIDWELESFHGDDYSIMNGSSQNAYLIEEEKTVLIDTRRRSTSAKSTSSWPTTASATIPARW